MNNAEGQNETYVKSSHQKYPWWKKALIGTIVVPLLLVFLHPAPYIIILIFLYILALQFFGTHRDRFLKLQATLPTSKIRSMAMGMIEVEGRVLVDKPLTTRIKARDCIGYVYTIEDISKDDQGKYTYSTVSEETVCNPFYLEDDSGKVYVDPTGIQFIWMPLTDQYTNNRKRYSQYVLSADDHVLVIGKSSLRGQVSIIERESSGLLGLAPATAVKNWNTHKPLRNTFLVYSTLIAFFMALVLVAPMKLENDKIVISTKDLVFKRVDLESFIDRKQETLKK